jgi:uncharacterized phage protein (TIGR01671 family)
MREILFRGKRKADGAWIVGHLVSNNYGTWIVNYCDIVGRFEYQEVIPETVGLFTGLTDKNGKEIFEGDKFGNENMPVRHVVFEDGKFCFNRVHSQGADALSQDRVGRLEIIGNIHDNQELIKQGGAK